MNVTAHPHQSWTAQQVVEAVGFDTDIARPIRDRDGIYGRAFNSRVDHLGIRVGCGEDDDASLHGERRIA